MLCLQELVEIVGRSTGIALMAPPTDSDTAQKTLDTLLSAVNKKQKVACTPPQPARQAVLLYISACVRAAMHCYAKPACKCCCYYANLMSNCFAAVTSCVLGRCPRCKDPTPFMAYRTMSKSNKYAYIHVVTSLFWPIILTKVYMMYALLCL